MNYKKNGAVFQAALTEIESCYLQEIEQTEASAPRKAKLLPMRKLGGIAFAACLAICAAIGVGILMKNATPPVSADPGIPDVCAEQGHDYSIVKEVTTGRIILQCSACESTKNLYDEIDESEYDSDESHFMYVDQIEAFGGLPGYMIPNLEPLGDQEDYTDTLGYSIGNEGDICVIGYTGNATKVKIPSTIDGKRVVSVCLAYNDHNKTITSLIFSEGIAAIYGSTCYDWKNLESVYFSDGLRVINGVTPTEIEVAVRPDTELWHGDYHAVHATPFRNCTKLTEVYFPEGFVNFGRQYAFTRCTGITRYYLPSSYTPDGGFASLFINENTKLCGANGKNWRGYFTNDLSLLEYEDGSFGCQSDENGKSHYYEQVGGEYIELFSEEDIQRAKDYFEYRDGNHIIIR